MPVASKPKDKVFTIPEVHFQTITVRIRGITPLLNNRFSDKSVGEIESKQQGAAKVKKAPRNPEEVFRDSYHIIDEEKGVYGFPAAGIKDCLVTAGFRFAGEKGTELRGVMNVLGDHNELVIIRGAEKESFASPVMVTHPVKIPGSSWTVAYRSQFAPWTMDVNVVFMVNFITADQIVNLFSLAGVSVGLGCWRPDHKGTMGQFTVAGVMA